MSSHPELVSRREAFFDECERRWGVRPQVVVETRDREQQAVFFVQWKNYLAGLQPARAIEAANPYAEGAWCPPELGRWRTKGSKHMLQADGYSHAEDIEFFELDPAEYYPLAECFGLALPVPKEPWHIEFWVKVFDDDGQPTGESVLLFNHVLLGVEDVPAPLPPIEEQEMPYLIIIGSQPGDAWFAVYPSGLVRHIGGSEAGFYVGDGATHKVPTLVEFDEAAYKGLIGQSGTAWRRAQ